MNIWPKQINSAHVTLDTSGKGKNIMNKSKNSKFIFIESMIRVKSRTKRSMYDKNYAKPQLHNPVK